MKVRALIVDDEALARKRLRRYGLASGLHIVGECTDGKQAIETIHKLEPDLVFLDVQMPEMDGFEMISAIGVERMPAVIFVTAHDEHALAAFESQAIDYLLKPVSEQRFAQAVEKARRFICANETHRLENQLSGLLKEVMSRANRPRHLAVRMDGRVVLWRCEDIDWIEAMGDYIKVHVAGKSHVVRGRMNDWERRLAPERFFRIHRSRIVNLDRVKECLPVCGAQYVVVLTSGTRLAAARECIRGLQAALTAL